MKVLFMTNVPSPYRVDFFNEFGKFCELTVLFEKKTSDERDSSWRNYKFVNFEGIFLKGKSINTDTAISFETIKYIKNKKYDRIICSDFSSPTGMIAIQYMKSHHIKYFLESDGGFAKSGKGFKESVKRYFISGAEGYFSTSLEHDRYYLTYGAEPEKIFRYPFTSLRKSDIESKISETVTKEKLRRELGIKEKNVILTVGQFIPRKGFDILIKAVKKIPNHIGLYIVGGKPTEEYLQLASDYSNIHFIGFKIKNGLKKYYLASDLFVFPTKEDIWGLVINEAMASGLPIITTNKCGAGLELVENGVNGYIVPIDNVEEIAKKIKLCLLSENCRSFGEKSLEKIQGYTFENMAQRHIEILLRNKA